MLATAHHSSSGMVKQKDFEVLDREVDAYIMVNISVLRLTVEALEPGFV